MAAPLFTLTAGDGLASRIGTTREALAGAKLILRSNVKTGDMVIIDGGLELVDEVVVTLDEDGKINGDTGITLLADDESLGLENSLQWQVNIKGARSQGFARSVTSWWINAGASGSTVSLDDQAKVPGQVAAGTTRGPRGYPLDELTRDGTELVGSVQGSEVGRVDISDFLLGVDDVLQETVENIVGNYEAETLALLDRITVRPDFDHRHAINTLIKALKDAGIWAKLDGLYLLAAHTQQAALLNWKANARNLTAYNSPVFTADRGIAGDGVSAFLQVPQFAGSTLSMTAGDESLGIWTRVNNANDNVYSLTIGTGSSGTGTNRFINPRTVSTGTTWKINTASQSSAAMAGGNDMFVALSRNTTDAYEYINGALEDSYTGALLDNPQALSLYVTIGRQSTTYSIRQHSAVFYGRYLSAAEQAVFYNALNDYMTALGAN